MKLRSPQASIQPNLATALPWFSKYSTFIGVRPSVSRVKR